jgi:hypothetical protein
MRPDKPDSNARELYRNLEREGWVYRRIGKTRKNEKAIPDAIVARKTSNRNHLLEIKRLGGRLSEEQAEFMRIWPGCVHVAHSSWEANLLLKECEER